MKDKENMAIVRWIHFSDLHLNSLNTETRLLRDKLEEFLCQQGIRCDYAFCSGDIRNAPDGELNDESLKQIEKICNSVGVSIDRMFIVPGNHDVERDLVSRKKALRRIFNPSASKKNGYYDPVKGIIKAEDITALNLGKARYYNDLKKIYNRDDAECITKADELHKVIVKDNLSIVLLDSTIAYSEKQEQNLIIGTNELYKALEGINPDNYTIVLSHYSLRALLLEEEKQLINVLSRFNVGLWLCGHYHDVEIKKQHGNLYELRCGSFIYDGGKPSVLIGELNTETGYGSVFAYIWQQGDGWILDNYLNREKVEDRSIVPFSIKPLSKVLLASESEDEKDELFLQLKKTAVERVGKQYAERYHILWNRRYGALEYPIVVKAILPSQTDTIYVFRKLNPEEYSLKQMQEWIETLSVYSANYAEIQNANVFAELQVIIPSFFTDRIELCRADFKNIVDTQFHGAEFQISFVSEDNLRNDYLDDCEDSTQKNIFIMSVDFTENEKEEVYYNQQNEIGDFRFSKPVIHEHTLALAGINRIIDDYYRRVSSEWKALLNSDAKWNCRLYDTLSYQVLYNDHGLLSIIFDRYVFTGGVHGIPKKEKKTFSLNSGKELVLSQIVNFSIDELYVRLKEQLLSQRICEDGAIADIYMQRIKTTFLNIDSFKFYINSIGSVVIFFDVYEIGDYSDRFLDLYIGSSGRVADLFIPTSGQKIIRKRENGESD